MIWRCLEGVVNQDEPSRMNLAVASKFIDGLKNDELRTLVATHYTPLSINAPTPEEIRLKSKEYLLLKPPLRSGYNKNNFGIFNNGLANRATICTNQVTTWTGDALVQVAVRPTISIPNLQTGHESDRLQP